MTGTRPGSFTGAAVLELDAPPSHVGTVLEPGRHLDDVGPVPQVSEGTNPAPLTLHSMVLP